MVPTCMRRWCFDVLCTLQVTALAWRTHGGMMLAVACANGICLWTLSRGLARHVAAGFA